MQCTRQQIFLAAAEYYEANRPIVQRLLRRSANREVFIQINKGNCGPVPLIGQFWTVAASAQLPVTL